MATRKSNLPETLASRFRREVQEEKNARQSSQSWDRTCKVLKAFLAAPSMDAHRDGVYALLKQQPSRDSEALLAEIRYNHAETILGMLYPAFSGKSGELMDWVASGDSDAFRFQGTELWKYVLQVARTADHFIIPVVLKNRRTLWVAANYYHHSDARRPRIVIPSGKPSLPDIILMPLAGYLAEQMR